MAFYKVYNSAAIKCTLKVFSTGKERFIKSGVHYLKERCAAPENSFLLATSVSHAFPWPSATDGLEEYEDSKIKVIATHFRKSRLVTENTKKC